MVLLCMFYSCSSQQILLDIHNEHQCIAPTQETKNEWKNPFLAE